MREAFEARHEREYFGKFADLEVQLVTVRVTASAACRHCAGPAGARRGASAPGHLGACSAVDATAERRPRPSTNARAARRRRVAGPAVIEQTDSTTVIPPGASARIDEIGNLVLRFRRRWHRTGELDPITLSVIGGAFKAIAKQMAQVLYRMSYSSIIRESEDLGCGIFFADGAELCESDTTPMHVGSIPGYLEGIISVGRRRHPRRGRLPPQRPLPGRLAHARPVHRDPDLPRRQALRVGLRQRPRGRRRRHVAGPDGPHGGRLRRGPPLHGPAHREQGRAQRGAVEAHLAEHAHARPGIAATPRR